MTVTAAKRLALTSCALIAFAHASSASAIVLGGCPSMFLPPPCLIIDPMKLVSNTADLQAKMNQLKSLNAMIQQADGLLKSIGSLGSSPLGSVTARVPINPGPPTTIAASVNKYAATMMPANPSNTMSLAATAYAMSNRREAALDGYALATATKASFARMASDADALSAAVKAGSLDVRSDWKVNTMARALFARALATRLEVQVARLHLASIDAIDTAKAPGTPRAETPPSAASPVPPYALQLGALSRATGALADLVAARTTLSAIATANRNLQQTQADFQATRSTLAAADVTMAQLALRTAQRQNADHRYQMSGAAVQALADDLAARAKATMAAQDATTWASANKGQAASAAGRNVANGVASIVWHADKSAWSSAAQLEADARKQVEFFQPIAADAAALQTSLNSYATTVAASVGVPDGSAAGIDRRAAAQQLQIAEITAALAAAPPAVQNQVSAIIRN